MVPSGPIDLGAAIGIALERHPLLEARALERAAAAGRAEQAGMLPNPRLWLASETNRVDDPFASGEHVAGLAVPIAWGGRLGAAERAAGQEGARRQALVDLARREVVLGVRAAFAGALAADEAVAATREIHDAASAAAQLVRSRIAEGEAREGDALRVDVDAARAALEVEAALFERRKALSDLAAAIGDADAYEQDILPKAERALAIAEEAYQSGATTIVDVLQARRTLAETSPRRTRK